MREREIYTLRLTERPRPRAWLGTDGWSAYLVMAWTDRFICTRWSMVRVLLAFVYGFVLHSK